MLLEGRDKINMDLQALCPFQPDDVDLSCERLSKEEKKWIVLNVVRGVATSTELSRKYNLKADTIRRHVRMYKKGIMVQASYGRPRILDKEAFEEVVALCVDHFEDYSLDLPNYILQEHCETMKRSRISISDEELPELLTDRTRKRYCTMIGAVIDNPGLFEVTHDLFT